MWSAHREIIKAITSVILRTQELERLAELGKLEPEINQYRHTIHKSIDLISPDGVDICQEFLGIAYDIRGGRRDSNDANPLKATRRRFYEYTAEFYGLEKMIPWMAKSAAHRSDA